MHLKFKKFQKSHRRFRFINILKKIFDPYLTLINSLPKVALGPLLIIWMGANIKSIIVMSLLINLIVSIVGFYNGFINTDEYKYLHECGADYVTVFQETYDVEKYEQLHLAGHKRVWPYRFDSQERALRAGMRGVAFSALLGLADFRKDALASALHVYYLQRKYPQAEFSLSCPRLRPIINNDKINPLDVGEKELCQVLCAYRIFLPFVGITVSSRESEEFRNGIVKLAATKVSAGVSTGIGDHESKYSGKEVDSPNGDEQFEINDARSFDSMYKDLSAEGLQPVLNDYLYL